MLPELAKVNLKESGSCIKIITHSVDGPRTMFNSYVQLEKPGMEPTFRSNRHTTQTTHEASLEALIMILFIEIATKKEESMKDMRSAMETFDECFQEHTD